MENNTIFDDVFQTIKEKMPELVIPLINEAFGTAYPQDIPILRGENEHHTVNGKIITDSYLIIGSRKYHLECQSTEDSTMILRMIEYDFAIGLEYAEKEDGIYQIRFPHSCVLYLRGGSQKDHMDLNLVFPDGQSVKYKVPVLRMQWYSLEDLLEKDLTMLLPFYVIRYEKLKEQLEKDGSLREELYEEYRNIENYLEEIFLQQGYEKAFRDMMELIGRITGYIFSESEKIKEGLGEIMGGRVLELESDRLIKQGERIGLERGEQIGLERGERIGLERGEQIGLERGERIGLERGEQIGLERGSVEKLTELVMKRMRKGDTPEQIAEFLEEDPDLIRKIYTTVQESAPEEALSRVCKAVLKK